MLSGRTRSRRTLFRAFLPLAALVVVLRPGEPAFGEDEFTVLPVGAEVHEWFKAQVDGLCANPPGSGTGIAVSEFRCADQAKAYQGSRAMLGGPGGLARRTAGAKQRFDALVPDPLVAPLLEACGKSDTGLEFAICAEKQVFSRLSSDPGLKALVASLSEDDRSLLLDADHALDLWVDSEVRHSLVTRICMQAGGIAQVDRSGSLVVAPRPVKPEESCRFDPFYDVPVEFSPDDAAGGLPPERLERLRDRLLIGVSGGIGEFSCPAFAGASEACAQERLLAKARAQTLEKIPDAGVPGAPMVSIDEDVLDAVLEADLADFLADYRKHYEAELGAMAGLLASELAGFDGLKSDSVKELATDFVEASSCFGAPESKKPRLLTPDAAAMGKWVEGLDRAADRVGNDAALVEFISGEFTRSDGRCTWVRDRVDPDAERRRDCEQMRLARLEAEARISSVRAAVPLLFNDVDGAPLWKALHEAPDSPSGTDAAQSRRLVRAALEAQAEEVIRLIQRHCDSPEESTRLALSYEPLAKEYLSKPGNEGRGFAFCAAYAGTLQKEGLRSSAVLLGQVGVGLATGPFGPLAMGASTFAVTAWDVQRSWERTEDRSGAFRAGMAGYEEHVRAEEERFRLGATLVVSGLLSMPGIDDMSAFVVQAKSATESAVARALPSTGELLSLRSALKAEGVQFSYAGAPGRMTLKITPDSTGHPINRYAALLEKEGYSLHYDPALRTRMGANGAVDAYGKKVVLALPEKGGVMPREGPGLVTRIHEHQHFRVNRKLRQGEGTFLGSSVSVLEGPLLGPNYGSYYRIDELNSFGWELEALCRSLASDIGKGAGKARFNFLDAEESLKTIASRAAGLNNLAERELSLVGEARRLISSPRYEPVVTRSEAGHWQAVFDLSVEGRVIRMSVPVPDAEISQVRESVLRQLDRMEAYSASVAGKSEAMLKDAYRAVFAVAPENRAAGLEAMRLYGVAQALPGEKGFRAWTSAQWRADFDQELQLQLQKLKTTAKP